MNKKAKLTNLFLISLALISIISAVFAYSYTASEIGFTPKDSTWKQSNGDAITNVNEAIDELYNRQDLVDKIVRKICVYQPTGSFGLNGQPGAYYYCEVGPGIFEYFYLLTVRGNYYDLIDEKSVLGTNMAWYNALNYFTNNTSGIQLKNDWSYVINIDLPSAKAVDDVVNKENWYPGSNNTWFYFETLNQTMSSAPSSTWKYLWLWDYTTGCNGCIHSPKDEAYGRGYWTKDMTSSTSDCWSVGRGGTLYVFACTYNTYLTVRPVITITKFNAY